MAGQSGGQGPEWHDWVGELFEPAFGATIDDLLGQNEEKEMKPRVKHISVHDPEAVKKVYEKVRIMTILDEEMRKQRAEKQLKAKQLRTRDTTVQPRVEEKPSRTYIQDVLKEEESPKKVDESCIWDSDEISVLREAFKSVKQQNIDAMVHVRLTVQRNKELETLCAKQKKTIEAQKEKLTETKKANRRMKLNVDSLNEEVKFLTAKVGAMEEVFGELTKEKSSMVDELHENRVAVDKERMERERIQIKLDLVKQEAVAEKMAVEDNIKTMCRKTILDLQQMVKKLEKELQEERDKRKVTEKGLKHLRTHFSSLPVQEILPPNMVYKDQVSRVQY